MGVRGGGGEGVGGGKLRACFFSLEFGYGSESVKEMPGRVEKERKERTGKEDYPLPASV